ncbi:methyl-accepting chemotaxis protein [Halobacillus sp. BAB-2008]|uniref:methyl-accepting chemotaxis protein n=1 Tax=Halobacillus sp. BAB-2008 TaxID=1246484 RepID=UPI0002A4F355|nr:methyl-accepting chemotaxis protein [Halobacillus sp. BAB-2008]ELK48694.1 methyl-accepting chemotaxis sensory transducer [Halobacillus sp. BAB-2008]
MTIAKRLYIMTLIPLFICLILIGFIVFQMMKLQQSSNQDVQILLETKELHGGLVTVEQALTTYGYNPSAAFQEDAETQIAQMEESFKEVAPLVTTAAQKRWYEQAEAKFADWKNRAQEALADSDVNEVQRQASRTAGITNDVYMLEQEGQSWYQNQIDRQKDTIRQLITFTIIAATVLLVLTILSTTRLTKHIAKPLRALADKAASIADGDLTTELVVMDKEKDEIGQLKRSFQTMVDQLRGTVSSVHQISRQVGTFSGRLNEEMHALTEVSDQVTQSTDELAAGSQSISNDMQDVASLMEELHHSFLKNTELGSASRQAGKQARAFVEEGRESVTSQRSLMEESSASLSRVEKSVTDFIQYTDRIDTTIKVVNDVAEQTNLLALNAAIEAARAGEHGKGFAVVAEEVRKLADQSTNATADISDMVSQIRNGVRSIEKEMTAALSLAKEQTGASAKSETAFERITDQVKTIDTRLEELVDELSHSKDRSENVHASMENVSSVIEQTAAGTEEISASTVEQQSAFEHLRKEAAHLTTMVTELNEQIDHFRWNKEQA